MTGTLPGLTQGQKSLWYFDRRVGSSCAFVTRPRARDAKHFCEESMLTLLLHAVNSTCAQRILERFPQREAVNHNDVGNINERLAKVCHAHFSCLHQKTNTIC